MHFGTRVSRRTEIVQIALRVILGQSRCLEGLPPQKARRTKSTLPPVLCTNGKSIAGKSEGQRITQLPHGFMSAHLSFGREQERVLDRKVPPRKRIDELLHLQDG